VAFLNNPAIVYCLILAERTHGYVQAKGNKKDNNKTGQGSDKVFAAEYLVCSP